MKLLLTVTGVQAVQVVLDGLQDLKFPNDSLLSLISYPKELRPIGTTCFMSPSVFVQAETGNPGSTTWSPRERIPCLSRSGGSSFARVTASTRTTGDEYKFGIGATDFLNIIKLVFEVEDNLL